MPDDTALTRGRRALADHAWRVAADNLTEADREQPLACDDLERLALARFLIGHDDASLDAWTRSYQRHVTDGQHIAAARCAFWAGYQSQVTGEMARANGWLTRATQALAECTDECVERGYVLIPAAVGYAESGDAERALPLFAEALSIGSTFQDATLTALGNLGLAHVHLLSGDVQHGLTLLDEVMVSTTSGEVQPQIAGIVYCATIIACQEVFDVRRAHEWTRALSRWCEKQQDLVPFRGQCLVHRAELMHLKGAWPDALSEVELARQRLSDPEGQPALGMAYYEEGELRRLRGEFAQAEAAYRHAHQLGHTPQPGLAWLWLKQGKTDAAASAIQSSLEGTDGPTRRARLLPAAVEISLAEGMPDAARTYAEELAQIATALGSPALRFVAEQQTGAVTLAAGDASEALRHLREAWRGWQSLDAPYEAAKTRRLMGRALRALGQEDLALMEFDAALVSFRALGAAADMLDMERESMTSDVAESPLTTRETEVLRLLASGATNRTIAVELVISEKTVARHVANIFAKLDLSNRAAATAYAYEHGIVRPA
jgi:ATP/maltotriose-dependent transcriptional regulator MalT